MKRGTIKHPKTEALARKLGIPLAQAVGHLEALWHFADEYARAGDVGKFDDAGIAAHCLWEKSPSKFVNALISCRWLDRNQTHRLVVHGWSEHATDYIRKHLERNGLSHFADGTPVRRESPGRPPQTPLKLDTNSPQTPEQTNKNSPRPACALPAPSLAPPTSASSRLALERIGMREPALSAIAEAEGANPDRIQAAWDEVRQGGQATNPLGLLAERLRVEFNLPEFPKRSRLDSAINGEFRRLRDQRRGSG